MSNIAIIPARSGSKGLKDKNIKELCGKPMMAYSIQAALESKQFDKVYVSTDSEKYASIAAQYGADTSFLRPNNLSGDQIGTWEVIKDAVDRFEEMGQYYENIAVLQPTAPLRTAEDIVRAFQLMKEKHASAIVGVCEVEHSPLWENILGSDLNMKDFIKQSILQTPRQELPVYYRISGVIYLIKRERLVKIETLYDDECYAYVMPKERSTDIDDEMDFKIVESILCC